MTKNLKNFIPLITMIILITCVSVFIFSSCNNVKKQIIICRIDSITLHKYKSTYDIVFHVTDTTTAHKSNSYYINRGADQGLSDKSFFPFLGSVVKIEAIDHTIESLSQNDKSIYKYVYKPQ